MNVNGDKRERNTLGSLVVQLPGDGVEIVLVSFCGLVCTNHLFRSCTLYIIYYMSQGSHYLWYYSPL